MDSLELINKFFELQARWNPVCIWVENERTWQTLSTILYAEMQKKSARGDSNAWINIVPITPVGDKAVRGRAMQKRHKSGGIHYDKQADWYPGYEAELLKFSAASDAVADDQFDSAAIAFRGFEDFYEIETEDFLTDDELEFEFQSRRTRKHSQAGGRNSVTGY